MNFGVPRLQVSNFELEFPNPKCKLKCQTKGRADSSSFLSCTSVVQGMLECTCISAFHLVHCSVDLHSQFSKLELVQVTARWPMEFLKGPANNTFSVSAMVPSIPGCLQGPCSVLKGQILRAWHEAWSLQPFTRAFKALCLFRYLKSFGCLKCRCWIIAGRKLSEAERFLN